MPMCFLRLKPWVMKSVILASWETVEFGLRKPSCSGGRMRFRCIKEFTLCATTCCRSLLTMLRRLIGLWEPGSESGLPGFLIGISLAVFQA